MGLLYSSIGLARDEIRYKRYTMQDGLSHRVVSAMVQDSIGYIWMSTWNGLCRFDGETFQTYNETTDGERIGRIAAVRLTIDGRIWVARQSDRKEYLFNPGTALLEPIEAKSIKVKKNSYVKEPNYTDSMGLVIVHDSVEYRIPYEGAGLTTNSHYSAMLDRQKNIWANFDDALYQITFTNPPYDIIEYPDLKNKAEKFGDEIRSFLQLRQGGYLVGCKNGCVYKYNQKWKLEGYLGADGRLHKEKTPFGARIYSLKQDEIGRLWLGSRGNGLYCIASAELDNRITHPQPIVHNYVEPILNNNNIFDIEVIDRNLIMLATWNGGIQTLTLNDAGEVLSSNNNKQIHKVRNIYAVSPDLFILCSTHGLLFVDRDLHAMAQLGDMDFSNVVRTKADTYYTSTLSDGVFTFQLPNRLSESNLQKVELTKLDLPNEDNIVLTLAQTSNGHLWFVSDNALLNYNPATQQAQRIDQMAFNQPVTFGEASPLTLDDQLIVGTTAGCMVVQLAPQAGYSPHLVFNVPDTLILHYGQQIPEIKAIAFDYRLPNLTRYAWRELPDTIWQEFEAGSRLRIDQLLPGMHTFQIRSTDANGIWADNQRTLYINVQLALWQKGIIALFGLLLVLLVYLGWEASHKTKPTSTPIKEDALLEGVQPSEPAVVERDQSFIEQATKNIEEHMAESQFDVDKLATYMGVSRTVLYNRFKEILNVTPAAFIADIKLKRSIQLLQKGQLRISEIAIMCGFNDPKYYARQFKQKIGITPAKYQEQLNAADAPENTPGANQPDNKDTETR